MKTYAGCVRVSHMGERKAGADNVHADRDQVEVIEAATPKGARLELLPPELDVSGGLPLAERPSLLAAVEGVESGKYAGIIVAYQSRLFRNVEEEEAVFRRVEAAGGEILFALGDLDSSTVSGRMVRRIKAATNTAEREEHAERFERLRRISTEAGIWQRRQTPTGYRKNPKTRRLVKDRRATAVGTAFRDFLAGTTISALAVRLGMTPSGVRQLLRNDVYLGILRVGKHVNPSAHPVIIDVDTFEAVQHRLDTAPRPSRNGNGPALLAGLVRCASCGHLMTRHTGKGQLVYSCPGKHSGERCPQPTGITLPRLEAHVEKIAIAELARLEVSATEGDRVERSRQTLARAERALDAYLDAVSAEDVGADAFNRAARKKSDAVDKAREEMRNELARRPALPQVGSGAEVWPKLNGAERNQLLRSLLAAIVVRPVGRGRRVPVADRVRVLAYGTDLELPERRGGEASGIVPIAFPDVDKVGVLSVLAGEDGAEGAGGAL
jgi:site-specific DNA recombinase